MKNSVKKLMLAVFIASFLFLSGSIFSYSGVRAETTAEDIRDKMNDLDKKLKKAEEELAAENAKLYKNKAQINSTQALIKQLQADIARREAELDSLNERAELNKAMLAEYMRQMYYAGQEDPVVKLSLFQGNLDDMVMNFDGMVSVKAKIIGALQIIADAKIETEETRAELADQKQDNQSVLRSQQVLQNQIAGEVQEKQATVAEIQKKISKLRSILSSFLGKSYSIDDVVDAVKEASKKTGVRKEFLFAMLDKETDLGRFTGGCTYDKSKMGSTNEGIFKRIADELGYNYKKLKVSCPLSYGIGGAMGVAQFMPTTWGDPDGSPVGWRPRIASATGHNPPDPWSLTDGIMGMALKLKSAGADSKSGEFNAAAAYYCGSRLSRAVCQNYAKTVISWSKGYDDYF